MEQERTRLGVVIVGGGFGGCYAAKQLGIDPEIAVTLIDRRHFRRPGASSRSWGSWSAWGPGSSPSTNMASRRTIRRRILGRPTEPFRYSNRGDVAVIGRLAGVTDIPWLGPLGRQGGITAWMLWLGIHIAYLIGFANRIVVVTRWAFSFLTHGRRTRLITGSPLLPEIAEPEPPVSLAPETKEPS